MDNCFALIKDAVDTGCLPAEVEHRMRLWLYNNNHREYGPPIRSGGHPDNVIEADEEPTLFPFGNVQLSFPLTGYEVNIHAQT